jgi:hypothetical protein
MLRDNPDQIYTNIFHAGLTAGVQFPAGAIEFSLERPDRLWGSTGLLSSGCRGLFLRLLSCRGVNLTTHLYLVPRSRMVELYLHFPNVFTAWCLIKYKERYTFTFTSMNNE